MGAVLARDKAGRDSLQIALFLSRASTAPTWEMHSKFKEYQSNKAIASAVASWMRPQSPFLTQALSIIQVPPTHMTLGCAM